MALLIRRLAFIWAITVAPIVYLNWYVGALSQLRLLFIFNYLSLLLHLVALWYVYWDLGRLARAMREALGDGFRWRDALRVYLFAPAVPGPEHIAQVVVQIRREIELEEQTAEQATQRKRAEELAQAERARRVELARSQRLERLIGRLRDRDIQAEEARVTAVRLLDDETATRAYFAQLDAQAVLARRCQELRDQGLLLGVGTEVEHCLERDQIEEASNVIERARVIIGRRELLLRLRARVQALPAHQRPTHTVRLAVAEQSVEADRPWRKALYELERGLEATST